MHFLSVCYAWFIPDSFNLKCIMNNIIPQLFTKFQDLVKIYEVDCLIYFITMACVFNPSEAEVEKSLDMS